MMHSMGWRGGGLCKAGDGITDPPHAVGTANRSGGPGLGYVAPRAPPRPKGARLAKGVHTNLIMHMVQGTPRITFLVHPKVARELVAIEDPDTSAPAAQKAHIYGYYDSYTCRLQLCSLSAKGLPTPTASYRGMVALDDTRKVLLADSGGVLGVAELTYPHPRSWKFRNVPGNIATATVRQVTAAINLRHTEPPSCMKNWQLRVGQTILWDRVALIIVSPLLTPRDYASYMKNVIHRTFLVRHIDDNAPDPRCRCCV